MSIQEYIAEIQKQYATGIAREHTYRPALQNLLAVMLPYLTISNEPARQECGVPDYILQRGDGNIPVAFIEAKDIGDTDLGGRNKHKEQFERYRSSLDNIIFTDYLDFWLYENGEFVDNVRIAELKGGKIVLMKGNFGKFESLIKHFGDAHSQKITSPAKLAEIMAGKARLLATVIEKTLAQGGGDGNLEGQMAAFKDVLIHDITPREFADIYAQTITYGMFAARLHDQKSPDTFSREEAAKLIPKTNPFLRKLFQDIAGYDLDERISWIVDDLAETFRVTDINAVMKGFGKRTQQTDPMIHFYEDFLSAYDPKLRKSRGVWYTPQAVVGFIVRAVDSILQTEFCLSMGLADTSKITVERSIDQSRDKRYVDHKKKEKIEVHKVQILDPATGTGTFLAETVSRIYEKFKGQAGMWQSYVEEHLLPRLNGFELLMASYTMAHLKLDWLLTETDYKAIKNERLQIFLTNSLEEFHKDTGTLFAQFLAREANGANEIKRNTPVMVVLGNPPYSGESKNKGEWIMRLMEDYKKEPDTNQPLRERNAKWINDDYCKFIRLGQYYVDRNNEGILAYINNHSFIDNPTFRGMRWNLMKSFDKIYILDLHGNSKKKEVAPNGNKDENVFDIQQGVSINIFIKTGDKPKGTLAEVYHYDIFGKRQMKYEFLTNNDFSLLKWTKLNPSSPEYFFAPKNYDSYNEYSTGFKIPELFIENSMGITSGDDKSYVAFIKNELLHLKDTNTVIKKYSYRIFDDRYIAYSSRKLARARANIMRNFDQEDNYGLLCLKGVRNNSTSKVYISTKYIDKSTLSTLDNCYIFPLYLYSHTNLLSENKTPNLNPKIVEKIAQDIELEFEPEKNGDADKFAPIDLLDYIYAVLHSPLYREKYKEFLKIDFPYVPYPENAEQFRLLAATGDELRRIHLMEHPDLSKLITQYPVAGNNTIKKPCWEPNADGTIGQVWINTDQYFDGIPTVVWNFYIGGYQPAQKWLKDRIGRTLSFDDIMHYQRIIKALAMTNKIMNEIK
ncbi:MAG: DNA methyltransferase [Bacteroidales bacterium]|jgi:predicted helicase|nr:DNA methyltransferase [Bacteroidales bacterium]